MKEVSSGDMLSLCKRRGFIYPAYEIYGGIAGLYDYGPLGTALKGNIADLWRKIYALQEGFVEIDGDNVGPEAVFKALLRALGSATLLDPGRKGVPSTKGMLV